VALKDHNKALVKKWISQRDETESLQKELKAKIALVDQLTAALDEERKKVITLTNDLRALREQQSTERNSRRSRRRHAGSQDGLEHGTQHKPMFFGRAKRFFGFLT